MKSPIDVSIKRSAEIDKSTIPTLSVVIATHNASTVIDECLAALQGQSSPDTHEIAVADSSTDGTDTIVRTRFPTVKLLHFTDQLTVPQLRARGIAAVSGRIIAILDPYSIVDPGWSEGLIAAHHVRSNLVIGGTVDLYEAERQNHLVWAQYINEYGIFMSPTPEGPAGILAGSNISYKRAALKNNPLVSDGGFWKTFVNETVDSAGSALWLAPDVRVALNKPIPFWSYLRTRFDHGRCYAGMRVARRSRNEKLLRGLSAPGLPLVLLWRTGTRYWWKKRHRGKLLSTLPLQLILFACWALGEMIGYLAGTGNSCKKLFY